MDNLIPLGISLLSACLKNAGHETKLFDTTFYKTKEISGDDARVNTLQVKKTNLEDFGIHERKTNMIEDFREMIDEFKPQLIAVSAVEPTYYVASKLLKGIMDIDIPKIMGGPLMTFAAEDIINEDFIDMICVGEAEEAIVDLVDAIESKKDYSNIVNLWVKKNDDVIKNPVRPLINLDKLPPQDWSVYEKERFFKPMGGKVNITGNFELSRGCNNRCAYCVNDAFQKIYDSKGQFLRYKPIKHFMDELREKINKYNLGYVYIVAENFLSMPKEMFDEFIKGYEEFKVPFWVNTRVETITEEKIKRLEEVNCVSMSVGIEQGNEEFRKNMLNRFMKNDTLRKAFEILHKFKIRVSANNIIGFPDETRELIFDTINLNRELKPDSIIVNIFNPYRGTKLYKIAVEKGYYEERSLAGDNRSDSLLNMPQLTPEQLKGLHRTFILYVRLPKEMWPEIEKAEKFDDEGNKTFQKLKEIYTRDFLN